MAGFKSIEIAGLRGFNTKQRLDLAMPDGRCGSGLTTIVGPNNSGKSTIFEAFRAISQDNPPSFAQGRRNESAGGVVEIKISAEGENSLSLKSVSGGGSETKFMESGLRRQDVKIFTLPARRAFRPFFNKDSTNRYAYIQRTHLSDFRGDSSDSFTSRLFQSQEESEAFNIELGKVLGYVPKWSIDLADNGQYFMKLTFDKAAHNSDGVGDGFVSIFNLIDSLYDSKDGDTIFIDEPELSLHPSLQRRMFELLLNYSRTRQIVISTHSPFFISWQSLQNGGHLCRTVKETSGIRIYQLKRKTIDDISSLLTNLQNPHILGLDASEVFFLEDDIILLEGQEDVVFLKRLLLKLEIDLKGTIYGWGIGGSANSDKIIVMLKDLGFKKVAVILDRDMQALVASLKVQFPDFQFSNFPTDSVREKRQSSAKLAVEGLIDEAGDKVNEKYSGELKQIFVDVNEYFRKLT